MKTVEKQGNMIKMIGWCVRQLGVFALFFGFLMIFSGCEKSEEKIDEESVITYEFVTESLPEKAISLIKEEEENDKQLDSFEKSLPKILQEKILDYKNKLYNDPKNVDKCYCELQAIINDMERQSLINSTQAPYLRKKYLGLVEKSNGDDKLLN